MEPIEIEGVILTQKKLNKTEGFPVIAQSQIVIEYSLFTRGLAGLAGTITALLDYIQRLKVRANLCRNAVLFC